MYIIIGLCVIGWITISFIIRTRNEIVEEKNNTKRAWSDVLAFQRRELRALEKMIEVMQEYMKFEGDLHTQITKLREGDQALLNDVIIFQSYKHVR